MKTPQQDLERELQDDEYALAYAEADRQSEEIIQRELYSKWRILWRLYYRIMPARFTGR